MNTEALVNPKIDAAYMLQLDITDESMEKWRDKIRDQVDTFADVHVIINGKVANFTWQEFKDRLGLG